MLNKINDVLSLFSVDRRELSPVEIVERLGRPKSTVYRRLTAMEEAGFLDRDQDTGRYRLGIRLAALGELARKSTSLQRAARPTLVKLSEETEETATLMVLGRQDGITVDVVESYQPLMLPGLLGGHLPLHATAGGKSLLAWRSQSEIRGILPRTLRRYTRHTITDREEFFAVLGRTRRRGYSTVNGEWVEEIVGVAAPVWNHRTEVVGALTVGGPRSRVDPGELDRTLAPPVVEAALDLSARLGHSPSKKSVGGQTVES
jgi:IclR family transcriptional regulator, KDG regulon repressor